MIMIITMARTMTMAMILIMIMNVILFNLQAAVRELGVQGATQVFKRTELKSLQSVIIYYEKI